MEYRFYWIGPDGHIKEAEYFDCASDVAAKERALELVGEFPTIEVWEGTRRVERLTGRSDAYSASQIDRSR
jgi:hypothetical protein